MSVIIIGGGDEAKAAIDTLKQASVCGNITHSEKQEIEHEYHCLVARAKRFNPDGTLK